MDKNEIFVPVFPWLIGASRIGGKYNIYTGSRGTDASSGCLGKNIFNYRIWLERPDEQEFLKAAVYYGEKSFECHGEDEIEVSVFEAESESLGEVKAWLENKYEEFLNN